MPQPKVARTDARQDFGSQTPESVPAGTELFALCQTATADGSLSPREIETLRAWLAESRRADLSTWRYVSRLLEHIVESGKVAPADLQALHAALEPSLSPELRRRPASLRIVDREWKSAGDVERERLRNEILAFAHFPVAGCQTERHAGVIERHARTGAPVLFVRDRDHAQSANTVEIRAANGKTLGFVPEQHASELAPLLDQGARYRAHLSSVRRGKYAPVLIVQAYVYPPDATLGARSVGARKLLAPDAPAKSWRLVRIAVAALITLSVAWVLRA